MEDIREYLQQETPDYEQGISLLRKHHKNRNLVNTLQRKENGHNVAKLRYELARLAGEPELATLPLPLRTGTDESEGNVASSEQNVLSSPEKVTSSAPNVASSDPSLAELMSQLTPAALTEVEAITKEMAKVFNQKAEKSNSLGDCENRAQRQEVINEINGLEQLYLELASKKQHLIEGGSLPEPAPTAPEEPAADQPSKEAQVAELMRRRNNLRSQVTKARKSGEKALTEAKKSEYEQKVGRLNAELEEVELQLKALTQ